MGICLIGFKRVYTCVLHDSGGFELDIETFGYQTIAQESKFDISPR